MNDSFIRSLATVTRPIMRTEPPDVVVASIVLNWNRRELTLACLASLEAMSVPAGVEHRIVVVDNGSTDGSAEAGARRFRMSCSWPSPRISASRPARTSGSGGRWTKVRPGRCS
ncbi:MAG: hypothetical protein IPG72_10580 [Ardenticatenales bacterium]|nr:hypothetical protein [Ardenticatenales bacterium]